MKRLTLLLLIAILIASVFGVAVVNGITQIPHENPLTAEGHFNFAPPLLHYSEIFGQIVKRDYQQARALVQELKLDLAHLPQELIFIMARYNELTTELTEILDRLDAVLDSCQQLLWQNKVDEASPKLDEARGLINDAVEFIVTVTAATDELLGLLGPFISPREVEAMNAAKARLQKAIERLRELEDWYRNRLNRLEEEIEEKEALSATELTLNIDPTEVWVGDQVILCGALKAEGIPIPARTVSISLKGRHFTTATTREDGSYEISFALPYWYIPQIIAQSFYLPQGDDKSSFTAASSEIKTMDVLFHPTNITVDIPDVVYPGLPAQIRGEVISKGNTQGRNVKASLDREPLFEAIADNHGLFQHQVVLARETWVGEHRLSIAVAPENESRCAGSSTDKALSVVKVTPEMTIHAPRFIVLPQKVDLARELRSPFLLQGRVGVTGEVHSSLLLQGAAVTLEMAGVSTTRTINEGSFDLGLDLPFKLDVVGFEEMKANLAPSEPWHLPAGRKVSIFVINLVYLGTVVAALILAGMVLLWKMPGMIWKGKGSPILPQELQTPGDVTEPQLPQIRPGAGDVKGLILQAYYMVVAGIQKLSKVILKPQMTLREFLSQVTPSLGRLTELFAKLTNLAEKVLYSRHVFGNEEASSAQGLASELRKGWLTISHWF